MKFHKRRSLFLILLTIATSPFWVHGLGQKPTKLEINKFRAMWSKSPESNITIGWGQTLPPSGDLKLYYDTTDHGTDVSLYKYQSKPTLSNSFKGMENVFVRLENLEADTKYYFIVADKNMMSRRLWFKTASLDNSDPISFIAGGDSRNNRTPRQLANLLVSKLRPDAVLFGGDMTDSGTSRQWQKWFDDWQLTIPSDGRITPLIIARGNHERSNSIMTNLFDTPPSVYYSVGFANGLARVYTLNTSASISGNQTKWLEDELFMHQKDTWKLGQYHKPMRPHVGRKSEGNQQYENWAPLFERFNMDLVIESDSHTVKTTWPITPDNKGDEGFKRDDVNGTVYIGEGCWGAPLRNNDDNKSWTRDSGRFNQFKWIFISLSQMQIRTVMVENAKSVTPLTDSNRFMIPKELMVWNPKNGPVISLKPHTHRKIKIANAE